MLYIDGCVWAHHHQRASQHESRIPWYTAVYCLQCIVFSDNKQNSHTFYMRPFLSVQCSVPGETVDAQTSDVSGIKKHRDDKQKEFDINLSIPSISISSRM